ncbi:MAG: DNA polymerase III subunit delta', partial [Actinobacteria bacterium]|nr:DNA polymerase III subunit delta' [Actinomycetota bacterium]
LLKAIEEPGARTVWLLCAPTITDVLPTIRSRCRHLLLRTPSQEAIVALLTSRDGIDPKMATFAARIAQGHIGRAKYLATNSESRSRRLQILNLPLKINDISAAFRAAATLLELATQDAESGSEERDDKELKSLQDAYQGTGRGLISGGAKAVKDLEKEQKSRQTRAVRDSIDNSLLDIATLYRDVMLMQSGSLDFLINTDLLSEVWEIAESTTPELTVKKIESIMQARTNLSHNAAPLLTLEALMCSLK